jgi:hypothetical protein
MDQSYIEVINPENPLVAIALPSTKLLDDLKY